MTERILSADEEGARTVRLRFGAVARLAIVIAVTVSVNACASGKDDAAPGAREYANFTIVAFASQQAAKDACTKEASWSAKYAKIQISAVGGGPSHAYYRNAGGLNGAYLTICLGTVVATTSLENGESAGSTCATAPPKWARSPTRTAKAST